MILPGADAPRAYALTARMRLAVRGLGLHHARSRFGIVTFSAGIATCVPERGAARWQALVGKADEALYEAKASGRDSVRAASVGRVAGLAEGQTVARETHPGRRQPWLVGTDPERMAANSRSHSVTGW